MRSPLSWAFLHEGTFPLGNYCLQGPVRNPDPSPPFLPLLRRHLSSEVSLPPDMGTALVLCVASFPMLSVSPSSQECDHRVKVNKDMATWGEDIRAASAHRNGRDPSSTFLRSFYFPGHGLSSWEKIKCKIGEDGNHRSFRRCGSPGQQQGSP